MSKLKIYIFLVLGATFFLILLSIKPYKVMTQSMEEVIMSGKTVLTIRGFEWSSFKKEDIVAFEINHSPVTFVKRIVAIPRDTLWIERDFLLVNGIEIPHDPIFEMMVTESNKADSVDLYSALNYRKYILKSSKLSDTALATRITFSKEEILVVPDNHYFMVGDNYYESMDSRFWGFIPKENIKGRVVLVF
ncbi:MAG: signal peptidase I [Balneola sp.]